MHFFNPNFFIYFLILLTISFVSFATGGMISKFLYFSQSKYFRVFFNLIIGYLFWICLTAFYFTKGNTILILIPLSALIWRIIFGHRQSTRTYSLSIWLNDAKVLIKQIWFLVFVFTLFAIKHVLANGVIEHDFLFYSNVAHSMTQSGVEGVNFGMFSSYIAKPYHYGDIWLITLLAQVFKINYYHTTIFISVPFLLFIVYSGSVALINEIGIRFYSRANLKFAFIFACVLFFIGGLDYPIIREYIPGTISLIQMPKLSLIYIIYILSLILILRTQFQYAFFVILLLPILYTQTAFFIMPAVGILVLISLMKKINISAKFLLYYMCIVASIALFYFFNLKLSDQISSVSYNQELIIEGFYSYPIQLLKKTIRFLIIYSPFLILFAISFKKRSKSYNLSRFKLTRSYFIIFGFLFFGFLFSLLFSSALSLVEFDFSQIYFNGLFPLLAIFSFIALIFTVYDIVIQKNDELFYVKIALLLIVSMGLILQQQRDPRYWGKIEKIDIDVVFYETLWKTLKGEDKIATFQNFETPDGLDGWPAYNYGLYPNLSRIANFNNNGVYFPECINVYDMDTVQKEHRKHHYHKSRFINFLDSLQSKDKSITPNKAQVLFVKTYGFDYVILPYNHNIPKEFKTIVVDSIRRNDGLRIYRLNID